MLYHFEYQTIDGSWEAVGSGEGVGRYPARDAFSNLTELSGGALLPGRYRYLPAHGSLGPAGAFSA